MAVAAVAVKVGGVKVTETARVTAKDKMLRPAALPQVTDVTLLSEMKIVQRKYARLNMVSKLTEVETIESHALFSHRLVVLVVIEFSSDIFK